jgi:hypothetical protein
MMSGTKTLEQASKAYSSADIYRDRGLVTFATLPADAVAARPEYHFTTEFGRATGLRFRFSGPQVCVELSAPKEGPIELTGAGFGGGTIDEAIARLTGITFGAAHVIPRLLLPELLGGHSILEPESSEEAGEEMVDGQPCAVVRAISGQRITTIWIGLSDFSIRQLARPDVAQDERVIALMNARGHYLGPNVSSVASITYTPAFERKA